MNGPTFAAPEELVPDIENMQVLYGIAPSGVAAASAYVTADQVDAADNVVSVQVALLVASPPGSKPMHAQRPTVDAIKSSQVEQAAPEQIDAERGGVSKEELAHRFDIGGADCPMFDSGPGISS